MAGSALRLRLGLRLRLQLRLGLRLCLGLRLRRGLRLRLGPRPAGRQGNSLSYFMFRHASAPESRLPHRNAQH